MARQAQQDDAPSMTRDQALALMEERAQVAQDELAGRTDAGADVLHYLAENGAPATRRAVAANPAATAVTNRHLADDADDDVRAELARKIGRLMPNLSRQEGDHVRALTIETLERLARDQVVRVRAILAEEIKSQSGIPKFIVQTLARDVETMVAAPVLEYSPLLSDADLMEIIATAKAEEVLSAIARRKPLDVAVSDAIVSSLDISAIAALLANPDARIREQTLDKLATQAEKIQSWHVVATRYSFDQLNQTFALQLGRVIVNRTGLEGDYDFTVDFTPDENTPNPLDPSLIINAMRDQLGLTVKSQKGPVEFLVIDNLDKVAEGN